MKRWIAAVAFSGAMFLSGAIASAQPADQSPIGGDGAHPHHVHTGNGECRDIDENTFEPRDRGLHRGASEGEVHHGTCAAGQH